MILGLLFILDPFMDESSGLVRVLLLVMFLIAIVFSGWVMFDTQRAMIWMASRGPEWWPGRATATRLANKPVWIWLYRIDCAIVFVGCLLMLITHFLKELRH
jgi:hypothetical protein